MKYRCETKELAIGYGSSAPCFRHHAGGRCRGRSWPSSGQTARANPPCSKRWRASWPLGGAVLLDGRSLTDYTGTARARKLALMLPPHPPHRADFLL